MNAGLRTLSLCLATVVMALLPTVADADPPSIESFPADGPPGLGIDFEIVPVLDAGAIPQLTFGQPDVTFETVDENGMPNPDLITEDTLMMSWGPPGLLADDEIWEAEAGWELIFGEDPDLTGGQITLSINPPGNVDANGNFVGIKSVSVVAIDVGNNVAGGWGFNTDQLGAIPPGNDPTAANGVSLLNNFMHNVTINIGAGPTPGSATVTGPLGAFVAPNFLIPGNNNFANVVSLQFFENGILRGTTVVIPGQTIPRLLNYWDHVTVTTPIVVPCTATPSLLWPPNHKMTPVQFTVHFSSPAGLKPFVSVLSNEPDDGDGDGATTGDVDGQSGSPFAANLSSKFSLDATGMLTGTIDLRAERAGGGSGRIYTIVATIPGSVPLEAGICTVEVPHDKVKQPKKK